MLSCLSKYNTTCIFHIQTQRNINALLPWPCVWTRCAPQERAFIRLLHQTLCLSSFLLGDTPYSCVQHICWAPLPLPQTLCASLFPSLCSSHNREHGVCKRIDCILSFFFFENHNSLVFNTSSAFPVTTVFVFNSVPFRRKMHFCLSFKVCSYLPIEQLFLCLTPCVNAFRLHCSALFAFFGASTPSLPLVVCVHVNRILVKRLKSSGSNAQQFFLNPHFSYLPVFFLVVHVVWELEQTPPSLSHPVLSFFLCV